MKYKLIINEKAVTSNLMYGRNGSRSFLSKEAVRLQDAIEEAMTDKYGYGYRQFEEPCVLKIRVERKGSFHWDLDNTLKAIQDGLVKAGVVVDDDQIVKLYAEKGQSRNKNCITLVIQEVEFPELWRWQDED